VPTQLRIVVPLGVSQIVAWASSFYLPAILADPIARDLGLTANWIFGAFSASLVISGMLGPRIGRQIDLFGGRLVLSASNIFLAAGLVVLAFSTNVAMLLFAWLLLGIGMGLGLYDAAFGALGRIFGVAARSSITGVALFAGFASTLGWPLTSYGLATIGWRDTCLLWALANILIGLPLNLIFIPGTSRHKDIAPHTEKPHIAIDRTMMLIAFAFSAALATASAMAMHFPRLMEIAGATPAQAVFAAMMIGPAQVVARIIEAAYLSRYHPLVSTRLACMGHPLGAALLGLFGTPAALVFAVLHGVGTGIYTIARGAVPLAIFGADNYAYRLGVIGAPSRITQAISPLIFSFLIDKMGLGALYVSAALSFAVLGALCLVQTEPPQPAK
jgi:MFS family permease